MRDGDCTDMSSCRCLLISCNIRLDCLGYIIDSSQSFSILSLRGFSVVSFVTILLVSGKQDLLGRANPSKLLILSFVAVQN
jgi:hypothetical protein